LDLEAELWARGLLRVVGVDEVGIGPICGPVVAAAVVVPPFRAAIAGVRDSKTVPPREREQLYDEIIVHALAFGVGAASVAEIGRLNILGASHLAMRRALARVGRADVVLVDGRPVRSDQLGPHRAIVDGDASCYAIACASIVAKVTRDRLMRKLGHRYPGYGWEKNAGYPTPDHLAALATRGVTPYHRVTFAPVRATLEHSAASDDQCP
jgi:ribonuclease HII